MGYYRRRPLTPVKVYTTTHDGRLQLAYLSLQGKSWRSTTSDPERQLIGAPTYYFEGADPTGELKFPSDIDYAIRSWGVTIAVHNKNIALNNARIKDPRKHEDEWNVMGEAQALRDLNPTQQNHLAILSIYLYPPVSWDSLPPYVNERGELPHYMRPSRGNKRPDTTLADIENA